MKSSIKFVVFIFSCCYPFLLPAQFCKQPLTITKLSGNCYIYVTCDSSGGDLYPANGMYIVTSKGVVMIDTPWDTTQFQTLLDSIKARHNKDVVLTISTHFHEDRTAGVNYYKTKGIRTYASRNTYDLCRIRNKPQPEFYFTRDTVFTVGEYKIQAYYPGAGHSPDNIVVWIEKEKVLYGGCLVKSTESPNLGNLGDARVDEWPATMNKLIKKYPTRKWVIPGHMGWSDKRSLEHTLKLLREYKK